MSTRRVDSLPDPNGNLTRLLVDVPEDGTAPRMHIRYVEDGGTTVFPLLVANIASLFRIRFRRFEPGPRRMFWGYLEYAPKANPVMEHDGVRKIILTYANVAGEWIVPPRLDGVPGSVPNLPLPLPTPDKINVTVTIEAETAPHSAGWINFDIAHGYPQQPIAASSAAFGYEQNLLFPFFNFGESNPERFAEPITGPLQFASVYRIDSQSQPQVAEGMILHVDDVDGHQTSATYDKVNHIFHQTLRNSMHLKGANFVRAADYQLSRPSPFGFGGNGIRYRLRGFRQRGAAAGVPVGWYEPAHLYREWLKARFPNGPLFVKHRPNRPKDAPVDTMSPHTVVQNWGLDGAADSKPHKLEMHPLTEPATHDENRPSFPHVATELGGMFPAPLQVKPEIQAWGIEKAGFYQFICGYPHLANVIRGPDTFRNGVAQVAGRGGVLSVTTDPASMIFDRKRYAGHIRRSGTGWVPMLDEPFPAAVRNNTCAVTQQTKDGKTFNRLWLVDGIAAAEDGATLRKSQKVTEWGELSAGPPVIGGGFYRAFGKQICPTTAVAGLYLDKWVGPHLFNQGVRIVEYMKAGAGGYFCFDTRHDHIPGHNDTLFDKVIGFGSWYVRRIKSIFETLHARGTAFDNQGPCSFRLSHEFEAPEQLIPYIDQYYSASELYNFVHSHLATPMMSPGRDLAGIHPNYRETPIATAAPPAYMLDPARDDHPVLRQRVGGMTPEQTDALHAERDPHFTAWRDEAVSYCRATFRVEEGNFGNAPRNYPVPGMGSKPIASYSYSRCIQDTFNLRSRIFENGEAAVRGIRIMIPSAWLEPPLEYNAAALQHAVLASRLQSRHKDFFRSGRMLGETLVTVNGQPPRTLCAWRCGARSFMDVAPLVELVGADDPQLGREWRDVGAPMHDFISRGWDKQSDCDVVVTPQVHHRVWEHVADNGARRVLYAFANLGNRPVTIRFTYGRGLEGAAGRSRTIAVNDGTPATKTISLGQAEELAMPKRSFAAVVIA